MSRQPFAQNGGRRGRKNPHVESLAVAFEIDVGQLSSLKEGASGSVPRPERCQTGGERTLTSMSLTWYSGVMFLYSDARVSLSSEI